MPGFDRTGPAGAGPRTGRARGLCNRPGERATAIEDPDLAASILDRGIARGYWPWAGGPGRRFRGGGRGRGRGFGRGWRAIEDAADPDATPRQHAAFLKWRMETLTEELNRVKERLSEYSSAEGEVRE